MPQAGSAVVLQEAHELLISRGLFSRSTFNQARQAIKQSPVFHDIECTSPAVLAPSAIFVLQGTLLVQIAENSVGVVRNGFLIPSFLGSQRHLNLRLLNDTTNLISQRGLQKGYIPPMVPDGWSGVLSAFAPKDPVENIFSFFGRST